MLHTFVTVSSSVRLVWCFEKDVIEVVKVVGLLKSARLPAA